jgi:hypothetical protein
MAVIPQGHQVPSPRPRPGFASNLGSRAKFTAIRRASSRAQARPHGAPSPGCRGNAGVLDPKGFDVLDDRPGRREAACCHCSTRAKCSRARRIAGLSGFLTLSQSRDGPDR